MEEYKKDVKFPYDNIENEQKMELLAKSIDSYIRFEGIDYGANARLNYSLYKTTKEKDEYSIIRLNKYRSKLGECKDSLISERIIFIIKEIEENGDKFNILLYEIRQYLFEYIEDVVFEELPLSHFRKYKKFLKHSKLKQSHLKKFVKYLDLMHEYLTCKFMFESFSPKNNDTIIENPHPRIFTSLYAYRVFEDLRLNVKNPLADYSFYYRVMIKDDLIFKSVGDSEYRDWLNLNYEIAIDKTKQLHICTTHNKERLYSTVKGNIQ